MIHRSIALSVLLTAVMALSALAPGPWRNSPADAATPVTFSVPVQVDPQRFSTEPGIAIAPWGAVFVSGPWGFSTGQSFLWRSLDVSNSYDILKLDVSPVGLRPCSSPVGPGGGDTDQIAFTSVDGHHVVVFVDLESLAGVLTCTSFDGGQTWAVQNVLTTTEQAEGGADRMWLGHDVLDGRDVLYLFSDDLVSGGDAVYRSVDYGAHWEVVAQPAFPQATSIGNPGGIAVDPATHTIYLANSDGNDVVVGVGAGAATGPLTFTERHVATMARAPYAADLVRIALDQVGNVYVSWLEPFDDSVKLSYSTDHGTTWSAPRTVSAAGTANAFTSIVAGTAGRVGLAWYTTAHTGVAIQQNSGPWYIAYTQSVNALDITPSYSYVVATPHAIHINPICTSGLNCTAGSGASDRNLGDFMSIGIDSDGAAFITYDDTANQIFDPLVTQTAGGPNTHVVRQLSGPSLLAGTGQVGSAHGKQAVTVPSSASDPAGDAYWPKQPVAGANIARLDLRAASLVGDLTGLHARITVADVTGLGITTSGNESWMLQWWWNNKLWYAKADSSPAGPVCYAGEPKPLAFGSGGNGKGAVYFGGTSTTCHIEAGTNTIVIDIPVSVVGTPGGGQTLHEVTAYSFVYDVPGTLMNQVDATNPFTFRVGN